MNWAAPRSRHFLHISPTIDNVAAATQGQAFAALLFLYKRVLNVGLALAGFRGSGDRPKRLPTVLPAQKFGECIAHLDGPCALVASLFTAAACAFSNRFGCDTRISISTGAPLWFATVKGLRTVLL